MHEILRHSNNGWGLTTSQLNIVMLASSKDTHKTASKGREWCQHQWSSWCWCHWQEATTLTRIMSNVLDWLHNNNHSAPSFAYSTAFKSNGNSSPGEKVYNNAGMRIIFNSDSNFVLLIKMNCFTVLTAVHDLTVIAASYSKRNTARKALSWCNKYGNSSPGENVYNNAGMRIIFNSDSNFVLLIKMNCFTILTTVHDLTVIATSHNKSNTARKALSGFVRQQVPADYKLNLPM